MKSLDRKPGGCQPVPREAERPCSSMCSIPCSSRSRSVPFIGPPPEALKLLRMSVSMRSSLGFAAFSPSASTPKVRYLVLMRPLLPQGKLVLEHLGIFQTDVVEIVALRRDGDGPCVIVLVGGHIH